MSTLIYESHVPESWLARVGGRDVTGWLGAFMEEPASAVDDLLWNRFYFGPLNLTERSQILYGWLDAIGELERFAARLDGALAGWVKENWGRFDREAPALASAWSCLCTVVEYSASLPEESHLTRSAAALRARFAGRHAFLGSFPTAPSSDPLGLYLALLAVFQGDDRSLVPLWHRMCDLPEEVPFYHARYAMLGLRRATPADPRETGMLRVEIVSGLLRLTRSFDRFAREQPALEPTLRRTFRRVAADTAAAFPGSPRWREHCESVEALPERARGWLVKAVPELGRPPSPRQALTSAQRVFAHVTCTNPGVYDYELILDDTDVARFHRELAECACTVRDGLGMTCEEYFNLAEQPAVSDFYEGPDRDAVRAELDSGDYTQSAVLWGVIERRIERQQEALEAGTAGLDGIRAWVDLFNEYLDCALMRTDAAGYLYVDEVWGFGPYLLQHILSGLRAPRPPRRFAAFQPFRPRLEELLGAINRGYRTPRNEGALLEWIKLYSTVIDAEA